MRTNCFLVVQQLLINSSAIAELRDAKKKLKSCYLLQNYTVNEKARCQGVVFL